MRGIPSTRTSTVFRAICMNYHYDIQYSITYTTKSTPLAGVNRLEKAIQARKPSRMDSIGEIAHLNLAIWMIDLPAINCPQSIHLASTPPSLPSFLTVCPPDFPATRFSSLNGNAGEILFSEFVLQLVRQHRNRIWYNLHNPSFGTTLQAQPFCFR